MIRAYSLSKGKVVGKQIKGSEVPKAISSPRLTWVVASGLGKEEITALFKKTKEVPDFLIKDCTTRQRPKIEEYTGTLSIVLHGVSGGMRPDQVNLIVGKNYVLALFKENDPAIAKAEEFLSKNPASIRAMGTGYVLYGFVDAIVGNYRPVIEALENKVDAIEERVLKNPDAAQLRSIMVVKKANLSLRRNIAPAREVLHVLGRDGHELVSKKSMPYFSDAYSDMVSVYDGLETLREALSNLMEIHLSLQSNVTNKVMKTLTVVASLVLVPSLIAGVYGMNLSRLPPPAGSQYGFYLILLLMLFLMAAMLAGFKKKEWLS